MPVVSVHCLVRPLLLALALGGALPLPAKAQPPVPCDGHPFPSQVTLNDGTALQLNGVGMRAVAWLQGYVAALYLKDLPRQEPIRSAEKVIERPGPKRIEIRMIESAESREFSKAFQRGVKRHYKEADLAPLADRVAAFSATVDGLPKLHKGDIVRVDFTAAGATVLTVKGKPQGDPVPGKDFYDAMLRVFVGDKPTDPELKTGLLGGKGC